MTTAILEGKSVLELAREVAKQQDEQRKRYAAEQERQHDEQQRQRHEQIIHEFEEAVPSLINALRAENWSITAEAPYTDNSGDRVIIKPAADSEWSISVRPPRSYHTKWRVTGIGGERDCAGNGDLRLKVLESIGSLHDYYLRQQREQAEVSQREQQRAATEAAERERYVAEQAALQKLVDEATAQAVGDAAFAWPEGFTLTVYTVEYQRNSHQQDAESDAVYDNAKVLCLDFPKADTALTRIERFGAHPITIPTAHLISIVEQKITRSENLPREWKRSVSTTVKGVVRNYDPAGWRRDENGGETVSASDEEGDPVRVPNDAIRAEILKRANC